MSIYFKNILHIYKSLRYFQVRENRRNRADVRRHGSLFPFRDPVSGLGMRSLQKENV